MRLAPKEMPTDHSLFEGQTSEDHHATAGGARFAINSQSIGAGLSYNLDVALGRSGCRVLRAVLRGNLNVDIQGHAGATIVSKSSTVGGEIDLILAGNNNTATLTLVPADSTGRGCFTGTYVIRLTTPGGKKYPAGSGSVEFEEWPFDT